MPTRRTLASLPLVAPLLAACQPLAVLNALVPKDDGSEQAIADQAYGPHPRQRMDIYVPSPRPSSAPLLMFFYGGSWSGGRREDYGFVGRAFAARGYVTAIPDYRLVPEVRFPEFVVDCGLALRAFPKMAVALGGEAGPVALAGHSAGAYNAVMLALDRTIAAKAGYEPRSIAAVAGISGPYSFLPLRVRATREAFAGVEDLEATQPVNLARADAPPMLLINGSEDQTVLPANATKLAQALVDEGVRAHVQLAYGQGHVGTLLALARPFRGKADVLGEIDRFFTDVRRRAEAGAATRLAAALPRAV